MKNCAEEDSYILGQGNGLNWKNNILRTSKIEKYWTSFMSCLKLGRIDSVMNNTGVFLWILRIFKNTFFCWIRPVAAYLYLGIFWMSRSMQFFSHSTENFFNKFIYIFSVSRGSFTVEYAKIWNHGILNWGCFFFIGFSLKSVLYFILNYFYRKFLVWNKWFKNSVNNVVFMGDCQKWRWAIGKKI